MRDSENDLDWTSVTADAGGLISGSFDLAAGGGKKAFTAFQLEAAGSGTAVPEPASLSLLGLGALALIRRRRA